MRTDLVPPPLLVYHTYKTSRPVPPFNFLQHSDLKHSPNRHGLSCHHHPISPAHGPVLSFSHRAVFRQPDVLPVSAMEDCRLTGPVYVAEVHCIIRCSWWLPPGFVVLGHLDLGIRGNCMHACTCAGVNRGRDRELGSTAQCDVSRASLSPHPLQSISVAFDCVLRGIITETVFCKY